MSLVVEIYKVTKLYPQSELYGLISQTRRSAISIPSNIAEGRRRGSKKDFIHFLIIAYASGAELETQVEIAKRLEFGKAQDFKAVDDLLDEVMRILNILTNKNYDKFKS